jgi:hypothetical protein
MYGIANNEALTCRWEAHEERLDIASFELRGKRVSEIFWISDSPPAEEGESLLGHLEWFRASTLPQSQHAFQDEMTDGRLGWGFKRVQFPLQDAI